MMTGSIKLFKFFREFHYGIGLIPSQANQKQYPINWRYIGFLSFLVHQTLDTYAFLVFEAKSMFEFGFSFYVSLVFTNAVIITILFDWQNEKVFEFIRTCERFVEKSKYQLNAIF